MDFSYETGIFNPWRIRSENKNLTIDLLVVCYWLFIIGYWLLVALPSWEGLGVGCCWLFVIGDLNFLTCSKLVFFSGENEIFCENIFTQFRFSMVLDNLMKKTHKIIDQRRCIGVMVS